MSMVNRRAATGPRRGVVALAILALALMTVGAAVAPGPRATRAADAVETVTTRTALELRAGPSARERTVLTIPTGSRVTVHEFPRNGFYPVTAGGNAGWVDGDQLAGDDAPTRPNPSLTGPSTGDAIVDIIYAAADRYGQPRADMLRVARCESNLDPYAVNPAGSYGLFQFLPGTWASTPYAASDMCDPWASANAAGWMWAAGRRGEWVCQ